MTREQAKRILSNLYGGHSVPGDVRRRDRWFDDLMRELQLGTLDIATADILIEEPVDEEGREYRFVRRVS